MQQALAARRVGHPVSQSLQPLLHSVVVGPFPQGMYRW
jgi:hypothetical protein